MQYQNEQTIAVMVKTIQQAINGIKHEQNIAIMVETIQQATNVISRELDNPSAPNVPEVVTGSFVVNPLKLSKSEKELYDFLAERKNGVNYQTICRELGITKYAFTNRLYNLRRSLKPVSIRVEKELTGSRRPRYRLASGE